VQKLAEKNTGKQEKQEQQPAPDCESTFMMDQATWSSLVTGETVNHKSRKPKSLEFPNNPQDVSAKSLQDQLDKQEDKKEQVKRASHEQPELKSKRLAAYIRNCINVTDPKFFYHINHSLKLRNPHVWSCFLLMAIPLDYLSVEDINELQAAVTSYDLEPYEDKDSKCDEYTSPDKFVRLLNSSQWGRLGKWMNALDQHVVSQVKTTPPFLDQCKKICSNIDSSLVITIKSLSDFAVELYPDMKDDDQWKNPIKKGHKVRNIGDKWKNISPSYMWIPIAVLVIGFFTWYFEFFSKGWPKTFM